MKRILSVLLAAALLFTLVPAAFSVGAVAVAIPNDNYRRPAVTAGAVAVRPKIDGKLDDAAWGEATKFPFTQESLQDGDGLLWSYEEPGTSTGFTALPEDGDGDAYIGWDSEYVYFALQVVDEEHQNNQVQGYDLWRGECLQMQIGHSQKSMFDDSARFELGFTCNSNDRQLGFRWVSNETGDVLRAGSAVDMSQGAGADYYYYVGRDDDEYTTTYEIALKHSWLGGDGLAAGEKFMFSFALHLHEEELPPACLPDPETYNGYFMEWAQGLITGKTLSEAGIITCGTSKVCTHTYDNACDTTCNTCGAVRQTSGHVYDNTCDSACNACGATRTAGHQYDNACDPACNVCGTLRAVAHVYGADRICDVCGYVNDKKDFFTVETKPNGTDAYDVIVYYETDKRLSNGVFDVQFDADVFTLAAQPTSDLKNAEINITDRQNGNLVVGFMNPATEQDIQDIIEFGGTEEDIFPKTGRVIQLKLKIKNAERETGRFSVMTNELVALDGDCAAIVQPAVVDMPLHFHSYDSDCDPYCNGCDEMRWAAHFYGEDTVCDVCGRVRSDDDFFSVTATPNGADTYDIVISYKTDKNLSNGVFDVLYTAEALELAGMPSGDLKNCEINRENHKNGELIVGFMNPATQDDIDMGFETEDEIFPKTGRVLQLALRIKESDLAVGRLMIATRELMALDGECAAIAQPIAVELSLHIHSYDNDCDSVCNGCGESREVSHTYDSDCDPYCNGCGQIRMIAHDYGNDNICDLCGYGENEFFTIEAEPLGADAYTVSIYFKTDKNLSNGVFDVLYDAEFFELAGMPTSELKNCEINRRYHQDGKLIVGFLNPATQDDIDMGFETEDEIFPKSGLVLRFALRIKAPSMSMGRLMIATRELVALDGECVAVAPPASAALSLHIHTYTDDFDATCNECGHTREPLLIRGDVDGNRHVDSTDARVTLQYAVQKIDAEDLMLLCADVDGNNKVDSTDARLILQYAVQKIDTFPAA